MKTTLASRKKKYRHYTKVLNLATIFVVVVLIVAFYAQIPGTCDPNNFMVQQSPVRFDLAFFSLAGIFFAVGISILGLTNYYYPSFYKDFSLQIAIVMLLIVLPLILQGLINNRLKNNINFAINFFLNLSFAQPLFVLGTQDLIVVTQLATFIFGLQQLNNF